MDEATDDPKNINSIDSVIDGLDKALCYTSDRADRLIMRLDAILLPVEDADSLVEPNGLLLGSPIRYRLQSLTERLDALGRRLDDVGDRVDL